MRSLYATVSALMKPRSKSVWMTPAAIGAVSPAGLEGCDRRFLLQVAELDPAIALRVIPKGGARAWGQGSELTPKALSGIALGFIGVAVLVPFRFSGHLAETLSAR